MRSSAHRDASAVEDPRQSMGALEVERHGRAFVLGSAVDFDPTKSLQPRVGIVLQCGFVSENGVPPEFRHIGEGRAKSRCLDDRRRARLEAMRRVIVRHRTRSRRPRASGASESSIDWFWQTIQRNSRDRSRARASFTGSVVISSGCTARAAGSPRHWVAEGDQIEVGERFGLIRFGSRLDVDLPIGTPLLVAVGQTATVGETVLAKLGGEASMRRHKTS